MLSAWSWHRICWCRKINLFRKLPPLWDIKAKVNLHRLSEIYFRYYLLHIRNCIVINNFNAKLHPQYPWVQFCINQYSNVSPSMISQPKSRKSLVFLTILLLPVKIRKPVFISVKHLSVLVRCSEHPEDVTIPFHRVHSVGHNYASAL